MTSGTPLTPRASLFDGVPGSLAFRWDWRRRERASPRRRTARPRTSASSAITDGRRTSPAASSRAAMRSAVSVTMHPLHGGAHRALGLRLGPPHLGEHVGGHAEGEDVAVAGGGPQRGGLGPGRAVDAAGLPPRPHLLGDVGQERRKQLEQRLQRHPERGLGRLGGRARRRRRGSSPARGSRRRTTRSEPRCARAPGRSRSGRRRRWPRRRGRPAR